MGDVYAPYEAGMERLLEGLGPDHPRYSEALVFQQRLHENIAQSRLYGESSDRRADRFAILGQLNELAMEALGQPFNDLCQARATSRPARGGSRGTSASGERGVAVGGDVQGSIIVTGDHNVINPPGPAVSAGAGGGEDLRPALERARRTLAILEQQAAGYTTLTLPAHLAVELEEKRKEVADLEKRLADR
jgi:hypothetical protein